MMEDVHFRKSDGAYNIACTLLKSNLSDLAASGAKPLYYMLGFSSAKNFDEKFIKEFCRGLKNVSDEFKLDLIGGDSVKTTDKLYFSLTIFGEILGNKSLKRSAAKAGDLVFVSGNVGDAFLGLQISEGAKFFLNKNDQKYLIDRHLQPAPKVALGIELVKQNLSKSAIDISDGFLADLLHICQESNLDAIIDQDKIPLSLAAKSFLSKNKDTNLNPLLSGGEDYELIFTAKTKSVEKIIELEEKIGVKITCVGHLKEASKHPKIHLLDENKKPIKIKKYGYLHY